MSTVCQEGGRGRGSRGWNAAEEQCTKTTTKTRVMIGGVGVVMMMMIVMKVV